MPKLKFPLFIFILISYALFSQTPTKTDSLEAALKSSGGKEKIEIMIRLANNYLKKNPEKSKVLAEQCLEISERSDDKEIDRLVSGLMIDMADFCKNNSDIPQASDYYAKSLQIRKEIGDPRLLVDIYQYLGYTKFVLAEYDLALECFFAELELCDKIDDHMPGINALISIGGVYIYMKKLDLALDFLQQASQLAEESGEISALGNSLSNIAAIHSMKGDHEHALEIYQKYLIALEKQDDKKSVATVWGNMGTIYQEMGDLDNALVYTEKSIDLTKEFGNFQSLSSRYIVMAEIYNELKKPLKAIEYGEIALDYAKQYDASIQIQTALATLAEISVELQDYKNAYNYLQEFREYENKMKSEKSDRRISELQVQYETDKKEKQIELLSKEKEIREITLRKNIRIRNLLIVIAALVLTIVVIIFLLYKHKIRINEFLERRVKEEVGKVQKQQQLLIQKSKLESLGQLAAGIAHEINQPLTRISLSTDNLELKSIKSDKTESEYVQKKCVTIHENVKRAQLIIEHIRTFSRDQKSEVFDKIDVNKIIIDILSFFHTQFRNHGINLQTDLSGAQEIIIGNRYEFEQIILNMLSNAKDAIEEKYDKMNTNFKNNLVKISTYREGSSILIEIYDNGSGIEESALDRIFDPFYTTKSEDKGTGLGLSVSYGLIKEMKGDVITESIKNEFTKIKLVFPLIDSFK